MDPSRAFAPGSPAGGTSIAAKVPGFAGPPGIPSLTTSATSSASLGMDNSGFVVSIGAGGASGAGPMAGMPWGLIAAGGLAWLLLRKRGG